MSRNNENIVRIVSSIRAQAQRVLDSTVRNNTLGTMTSNGIYIDSIEDEIPREDFLILQTGEDIKNGDRVVCIPIGDYYVVLGKVV